MNGVEGIRNGQGETVEEALQCDLWWLPPWKIKETRRSDRSRVLGLEVMYIIDRRMFLSRWKGMDGVLCFGGGEEYRDVSCPREGHTPIGGEV